MNIKRVSVAGNVYVWKVSDPGFRRCVAAVSLFSSEKPAHVSLDFADPFAGGELVSVTTLHNNICAAGESTTAFLDVLASHHTGVLITLRRRDLVVLIPESLRSRIRSSIPQMAPVVSQETVTEAQCSALVREAEAWMLSLTEEQITKFLEA